MAEKHFYEQKEYTNKYLLPYFQKHVPNFHKAKILEVGCAEGGLLEVLHKIGMHVVGLEINEARAKTFIVKNPGVKVHVGNITDPKVTNDINETFDVIIMREVIEHIHNKEAAFNNLSKLLKGNGYLYISFPPKFSPFAGHQQIAKSILKIIPYLHLFPKFILKPIAKAFGENDYYADEIKLHFATGCTINEFELYCSKMNFKSIKKELFLFRPIYGLRFGLPKIKLPDILFFREFLIFGCETLLQKKIY